MLHPLFSTLVQRPDLVMDHASAYVELLHEEASVAGTELLGKAMAWALAVLTGMTFLGLGGAALMLGVLHNQFHWVLVAVPGVALLLAIAAVVRASKPLSKQRFAELKAQIRDDARVLRAAA